MKTKIKKQIIKEATDKLTGYSFNEIYFHSLEELDMLNDLEFNSHARYCQGYLNVLSFSPIMPKVILTKKYVFLLASKQVMPAVTFYIYMCVEQ